ncbi:hypothetical protein [Streptomyces sp. NBC_00344]|uniref:hypothetical protein n=1 Tax=Streptomyces sp. NBC_00344 TaxID=2975720 RepID=UPI002E1D824B
MHLPHVNPDNVWAEDLAIGQRRLLNREEDNAFWACAIIEVLRHTGVHAEEMLELSHHSLVQYRLPTTGEIVPLLQIAPSKTDAERLLVVSPELADVLSAIICRIRDTGGAVPLVRTRDYHEHVWMPPAPLLFQHCVAAEPQRIARERVSALLDDALSRTGLVDSAPLHSARWGRCDDCPAQLLAQGLALSWQRWALVRIDQGDREVVQVPPQVENATHVEQRQEQCHQRGQDGRHEPNFAATCHNGGACTWLLLPGTR